MPKGYLTFVLHSHMAYVRQTGRRPHGEEMLHEAIAETYVPLLNSLYDLRAAGVPFALTIGITPILAEQLADPDVLDRFETFFMEKLRHAEQDEQRFRQSMQRARESEVTQAAHCVYLARFYVDWYRNLLGVFRERFGRDLVGAFRLLQDEGLIEIITSAATHAYLPLIGRDSTLYAQLRTAVTSYLRHFARLPRGLWLPECGYRPAYRQDEEILKPGLEAFLAELNLRYTFSESHMIEQGRLAREVIGEAVSPAGRLPRRELIVQPLGQEQSMGQHGTFQAYTIQGSNVAVYGRDPHTGRQVWSAEEGYPGDFAYREFYRKDAHSGLRYWRTTGDQIDLGDKELYDPYHAFHRAKEHAAHFVGVVRGYLSACLEQRGQPGIIVAAYDTELFGHWWFEGTTWLREVLAFLGQDPEIALTTAGEYLEEHPPQESIVLPEGSWGKGGDHSTWLNRDTEWMWPLLHEAERLMETLVARFPDAQGEKLEVLKQTARELLLLQSSDWPFLVGSDQAAAYAKERFQGHLARFHRLSLLAEKDVLSEDDRFFLQECQHLDNPFMNIDYRAFAAREDQAG